MLLESNSTNFPLSAKSTPTAFLAEKTVKLDFPHRLFVPQSYEPNYPYPLVVWLHSDASSELELDGIMAALSIRNYIAIAPRANLKSRGHQRRYRWGTSSTDCAVAEDLVWDSVQSAVESLSIHPERIFLAGFGGGATMAQWIGLKYASQVAGVVSLSGAFPKTQRVLSNWKNARELDVLFGQRQGSNLCSDDAFLRTVKTSYQSCLNYKFVQFRDEECKSSSDELDSSMLECANRFMMSLVTGTELQLSPETPCEKECMEFGFN